MRRAFLAAIVVCGIPGAVAWTAEEQAARTQSRQRADAPVAVPEPSPLAVAYYRSGNWIWLADQLLSLAVPALFLLTGLSVRLRNWAWAVGRTWFVAVCLYWIMFAAISFLLLLPWSFFVGFVRQHAYGLSNQTLGKWAFDSGFELLIALVGGCLVLWFPYLLAARSLRRWWLYTGLAALPWMAAVMFVFPIWIQPLFNASGPMKDKGLEAKILQLAERAGIESDRVYEIEKSVDTKAVNAYVCGVAGTHRIVLWDTLLEKLDDRQVLFVMAHEMGHYALGHVLETLVVLSVVLVGVLGLVHLAARWVLARWRARLGFGELSDLASLPLVLALLQVLMFLVSPAVLAYSRHNEREADRFALELVQDNRAGAEAFIRLQESNLSYPRPGTLYIVWRSTHPTIADRVEFCNTYRPWAEGRPLVYERYFRPAAIMERPEPLGARSASARRR